MSTTQKAVQELLDLKDQRKAVERMIDLKLQSIAKLLKPGETVELDDTSYELKDNFAETNIVFRPAAVYRFDIAEVKDK